MQEEYDKIVDEVSDEYEYSDDLKNTLKRVLPAMLAEATPEAKETFYKMLRRTPIVVLPKNLEITSEELDQRFFGDINHHIKDLESDVLGEYTSSRLTGGFSYEPVLDEELNVLGGKQYIYIRDEFSGNSERDSRAREILGTSMQVAHLIHELGHAWHSENNQFYKKDGKLVQRCGTSELYYEFNKQEDGTYARKLIKSEGLILEDSLNTIEEEKSMARFLGISREEVHDDIYKNLLYFSNYQSTVMWIGDSLLTLDDKHAIDEWRLTGDLSKVNELMYIMEQTDAYRTRTIPKEYDEKKKTLLSMPPNDYLRKKFQSRSEDFFYDKGALNPLEIVAHSMVESFDIAVNKYSFDIISSPEKKQYYIDVVNATRASAYEIINQTMDILQDPEKKAEILAKRAEMIAEQEGKQSLGHLVEANAPRLGMADIGQASKTLEKADAFHEVLHEAAIEESKTVEI